MNDGEKATYDVDTLHTLTGFDAPRDWSLVEWKRDDLGLYFMHWVRIFGKKLSVIETADYKSDGRLWHHVSVATPKKNVLPSWQDVAEIRKLFIGEERESYIIFPTKERYVNIYDVIHLYCCLDAPGGVLPSMEGEITIGGMETAAGRMLRGDGKVKSGEKVIRSV